MKLRLLAITEGFNSSSRRSLDYDRLKNEKALRCLRCFVWLHSQYSQCCTVVHIHVNWGFESAELSCVSCWVELWDRCRDKKDWQEETGCACTVAVLTGLWYFSKEFKRVCVSQKNLLPFLLGPCRCVWLEACFPSCRCSLPSTVARDYLLCVSVCDVTDARAYRRWTSF